MHQTKSRRTSHYPISIFLSYFFKTLNINVTDFIGLLGYKNRSKGIARFDQWLCEGRGKADFLERVIRTYPGIRTSVEQALNETKHKQLQELEAYERANFKPYIFLETKETRPDSITMFAITGGKSKFLRLPAGFSALSKAEQMAAARVEILKHQRSGGHCPFFGATTAYRLVPDFDSSILFDLLGNLVLEESRHFQLPFCAYVTLR